MALRRLTWGEKLSRSFKYWLQTEGLPYIYLKPDYFMQNLKYYVYLYYKSNMAENNLVF